MKNPFKFGTVVEDEYFTDRIKETQYIRQLLDSENHLILISPRRFGKSSVVLKAVKQSKYPYLMLNLQKVVSTEDFAAQLLKEVFRLRPFERIRHLMSHFRIIPTMSVNPMTDGVEVSFQPTVDNRVLLEDAMLLLEKVGSNMGKLVVILDEFQEIRVIDKNLDKQLRSIMQLQHNLNYVILGSQESMMTEIFERKKSPFYHFGTLMHLSKIPYDDFFAYVSERISPILGSDGEMVAQEILLYTSCHPYYTQQLASQVWQLAYYEEVRQDLVAQAVERLVTVHDLDFERLWLGFNRMDKRIMQMLCRNKNPLQDKSLPTSTAYSAVKRLVKMGYVVRTERYELEDPFFKRWINARQM